MPILAHFRLLHDINLEKEMASHSNILVWEIPWTEEPGGLQSMGSQKSWTQLGNWTTTTMTVTSSQNCWRCNNQLSWDSSGCVQRITANLVQRCQGTKSSIREYRPPPEGLGSVLDQMKQDLWEPTEWSRETHSSLGGWIELWHTYVWGTVLRLT